MSGAGADPLNLKNGDIFSYVLGIKEGQKIHVNAHGKSNFLKKLVSRESFRSNKHWFRKKSVLNFPEFLVWKMLLSYLQKILSMLVRRCNLSYNILKFW